MTADQPHQALRRFHAVGDRHDLGQHRHMVGQLVGYPEDARAGQEIHVLGPAAEQVRCRPAMQAVAVILGVLTHVVGVVVAAEMAFPAGDIGGGHDPVAYLQRPAFAVAHLAAKRHDLADILMAADERVSQVLFLGRAGVLLALATEGVLVGAADSGIADLHDDATLCRLRHGKIVQGDPPRLLHHGCAYLGHGTISCLPPPLGRFLLVTNLPD